MPTVQTQIVRPLFLLSLFVHVACSGGGESSDAMESDAAQDSPPEAMAPETLEESIALTVDGETPELVQMTTCVATPGRGLGTQWSTADFIGDGSRGLGVAAGFDGDQAQITITFRDQRWRAAGDEGEVSFQRTDSRTQGGRSFVTVVASGRAVADGESVPFELSVTCEPGGR
jgi:hypothetical protein